jgi:carbonic anhydrase
MAQVHAALQALLDSNAQWARDIDVAEPDFFQQSAKGQSPQVRPSAIAKD